MLLSERSNSRSDVSCISGSIARLQCFSPNTRCFPESVLMTSLFLVPQRNTKAFFCYPLATLKLKSCCSLLYGLEDLGTFWPQPYSRIIFQKKRWPVSRFYAEINTVIATSKPQLGILWVKPALSQPRLEGFLQVSRKTL